MSTKDKKMCKWKKGDVEDDFKTFKSLVGKPKYACKNCARVAAKKKVICKPISLA